MPEQDDSNKKKPQMIYLPACQGKPLWEALNIQELPSLKTPGVAPAPPAPEAVRLATRQPAMHTRAGVGPSQAPRNCSNEAPQHPRMPMATRRGAKGRTEPEPWGPKLTL